MRRVLFASLLTAIAITAAFGFVWFVVRGGHGGENADETLMRLSKQGAGLTYYGRYEAADPSDSNAIGQITFYTDPGVGFRFDLGSPLAPDFDADQQDDVLKSGDILIVNPALPETYISCRTQRHSCRTADGLERLITLSFWTLFRYDVPFFEQPHSVNRADDIVAAGERAQCFVISQRTGTANEQATAEESGSVSDAGLPKTVCYASDGVPLGGLISDRSPNTDRLKAVEIRREIDPSVFEPPFPMVPSSYDSTPTALPPTP